jgi:hypothetical protein
MEIVAESTQAGNSQLTRAKPEVNSRQRKRLITPSPQAGTPRDEVWLDLDREAVVEITSEEKEYPVEAALAAGETRGWRAADSRATGVHCRG